MRSYPSLRKLIPYMRRYLKQTVASLVCMTISSASTGAFIYFIRKLLAPIIEKGDLAELARSSLELAGVGMVMAVSGFLQTYLSNYVGQRVLTDLRQDLFEHLQKLSLSYFENKKTGELMSRMTNDLTVVQRVMTLVTIGALAAPLTLLFILGQMMWWSWRLTLLACVGVPIIAFVISRAGRRVGVNQRRVQEKMAELSDLLQERLSGVRIIQCFTREDFETARFRETNQKSLWEIMHGVRVQAELTSAIDIVAMLSLIAVIFAGGMEVLANRISPATLLTFLAAINLAVAQVKKVSNVVVTLRQMEAAVARLFQILDVVPEIQDLPGAVDLESVQGAIHFSRVHFAYDSANPVLQDVTFSIAPGEKVALVGPSGAGKTTVANLIPRLYDVTSGCIFIDGIPLQQIKVRSLRSHIGIVPQEAFLFAGTVFENIAYGRMDATEREVYTAAQQANADAFIHELPRGYATVIGERGTTLSGGQRQRIAIARAILRDPRILILDEATSSLDAESEAVVQEALDQLMANRTTLIIAHRLCTIRNADRILVLDRGRIVEEGTHTDLMQQDGLYRRLYETQMAEPGTMRQPSYAFMLPAEEQVSPHG